MDSFVIAAALDNQVTGWLDNFGPFIFYLFVWLLVFSGTGLFIGVFIPFVTGDSLLFAAGLLAATSHDLNVAILAVGVGAAAFLGDQVGFVLGRHYGRPYLDRRKGLRLRSAIIRSEKFYDNLGWWAVVVARFIPLVRTLVPAVAGIARMNYFKFLWANLTGSLAWGVGLTLTGFYAATIPAVKSGAYAIAAFFIIGSVVAGIQSWISNRRTS